MLEVVIFITCIVLLIAFHRVLFGLAQIALGLLVAAAYVLAPIALIVFLFGMAR